jgi:hypothetical protein
MAWVAELAMRAKPWFQALFQRPASVWLKAWQEQQLDCQDF